MQQQLRKVPCISPDISCNLIVLSLNYPRLQVLIHGNLHGLLLVVEKTISRLLYNRRVMRLVYQKTVLLLIPPINVVYNRLEAQITAICLHNLAGPRTLAGRCGY